VRLTPPCPGAYWVRPGLIAGRFPARGSTELSALLAAGVTRFIDLTEAGELPAYTLDLPAGVDHQRMPIQDFTVPPPQRMEEILKALAVGLAGGRTIYLHCHGGIGRTGTVVGCYLVRQGMTGAEALLEIHRLRLGAGCHPDSPETETQRAMVLQWPALTT
jgi:protein-tyrosine phosphatase